MDTAEWSYKYFHGLSTVAIKPSSKSLWGCRETVWQLLHACVSLFTLQLPQIYATVAQLFAKYCWVLRMVPALLAFQWARHGHSRVGSCFTVPAIKRVEKGIAVVLPLNSGNPEESSTGWDPSCWSWHSACITSGWGSSASSDSSTKWKELSVFYLYSTELCGTPRFSKSDVLLNISIGTVS